MKTHTKILVFALLSISFNIFSQVGFLQKVKKQDIKTSITTDTIITRDTTFKTNTVYTLIKKDGVDTKDSTITRDTLVKENIIVKTDTISKRKGFKLAWFQIVKPGVKRRYKFMDTTNKVAYKGYVFTDLAGANDDQPNGLLQSKFFFSWPLFSKALGKKKKGNYNLSRGFFFLRNVVVPEINLTKIENDDRYLTVRHYDLSPSDNTNTSAVVNRLDLIQYANINVNAKLNIFTLFYRKNIEGKYFRDNKSYIDFQASHYRTGVVDSLNSNRLDQLNSYALGMNLKHTISDTKSGLSLGLNYFMKILNLRKPNYKAVETERYEDYSSTRINRFIESGSKLVSGGHILVSYKSSKSNSTSFLRVSYFTNGWILDKNENFFQVQLGTSLPIEKLFNNQPFYQANKQNNKPNTSAPTPKPTPVPVPTGN